MKAETRKTVEREMVQIFGSWRWLIKKKLEELDYMTRQMQKEMQCQYISGKISGHYIANEFATLWEEVALEQSQKYGTNGTRIKEERQVIKSARTVIPNHRGEKTEKMSSEVLEYTLPAEEIAKIFANIKPLRMSDGTQRRGLIKLNVGDKVRSKRGLENRGKLKSIGK